MLQEFPSVPGTAVLGMVAGTDRLIQRRIWQALASMLVFAGIALGELGPKVRSATMMQ